jgi:hypothetical protein
MEVKVLGNVTLTRLVALWNEPPPSEVTPSGMTMLVRLQASSNALEPIVVRLVGSVIEVSAELLNAESPIVVTGLPSIDDGTVTELGHVVRQPVTVTFESLTE